MMVKQSEAIARLKHQQELEQSLISSLPLDDIAGQGMEGVSQDDLLISRLLVAQKLSPQVDPNNAGYIAGAEEGNICSTGQSAAYEDVLFVPAAYRKYWIEWAPLTDKRGIIEVHSTADVLRHCTRTDRGWVHSNGNDVKETAQFFGFHLIEGLPPQLSFIAMASTQLKKARIWLTMASAEEIEQKMKDGSIKRTRAPLWWRVYQLETQREGNQQGNWYGWQVSRDDTLLSWCIDNDRDFSEMARECVALNKTVDNFATRENVQASAGGDSPSNDGDDPPF